MVLVFLAAFMGCSDEVSNVGSEPSAASVLDVRAEPAGEHCADGGLAVSTGIDDDRDGILDPTEVDTTAYVCNGAQGQAGAPGRDGEDGVNGQDGNNGRDGCRSLLVIDDEAPGENCPGGGKRITTGADDGLNADGNPAGEACDGLLAPGEVDQVDYLCTPEAGTALGTLLLTVTTGMHEDADVADGDAPDFCLTRDDCYGPLNHLGTDDYTRGLTDTYRIENVPLALSEIEELTFRANGTDGWQPTCVEVQWNGRPLYCNDQLEPFWVQTDGDPSWTAVDGNGDPVVRYQGCARGTCYPSEIVAGPIIGAVTPSSAKVWVRTAVRRPVEVRIHADEDMLPFSDPVAVGLPQDGDDYALTLDVADLEPSSLYHYSVTVGDSTSSESFFVTSPPANTPQNFTFATGSCTKVNADADQLIFEQIREANPAFFLFLGDNHYGNSGSLDRIRAFQKRARAVPARSAFLKNVPVYATWDDHDFIENNSGGVGVCNIPGTPLNEDEEAFCGEIRPPANAQFNESVVTLRSKRDNALKAFKEAWPNPAFGTPDTAGVFHTFSYGDVDVFMLDSRYHRTPEFTPGTHTVGRIGGRLPADAREMFGAAQIQWLRRALQNSTATFKFLASGSTWNAEGSNDSFAYFDQEREALFDFIAEENISGVILLSGDIHRSGFTTAVPQNKAVTGGYDLPELISSPMANRNAGNCALDGSQDYATTNATQCFNEGHYFMTIEVDTTQADPRVVARIFDDAGTLQGSPHEIRLSQLTTAE